MKFSEYPFIRYVVFFITGILMYPYAGFMGFGDILALVIGCFVAYLILAVFDAQQQSFRRKLAFPAVGYLLLISMGLFFTFLKDAKNDPTHLLYHPQVDGYLGLVEDLDQKKPNTFANRVAVKTVKVAGEYRPASGEVIIYHKLPDHLMPGEMVWIEGSPGAIPPPQNPYEFNYHRFLAHQQIFHSHFVDTRVYRVDQVNHSPVNNFVLRIRASIQEKIDQYILTPHSNQIAKALLLGQKKHLEKEVSEAYVTAGTMHVLAVSGLHVGIIYGFFFLFIKPYKLSGKKRVLYLSFVILIIWVYALITGMSPSVMRAATMFTLMGLAQMKSRSPSIYNSLALSALILLVFDPLILYSVGFQLSYMAVLGIVLLQPKISQLWQPKSKVGTYLWDITTVGIAAQLATYPISVHYFHVFPTYFMISNLIAIPGAFLVMSVGIPFMLLSFVAPVAQILGKMVDYIIYLQNEAIFTFQNWPLARIEHIHFPPVEMLLFWSMVISIYLLFTERRKKYVYLSLSLFLGLITSNWVALWNDHQRNELYIYQVGKQLAVDHFYYGKLYSRIEEISPQDLSYKVLPNRIKMGHSQPVELKYLEGERSKYLFLPGGSVLQLNRDGIEIQAPFILSVSQYRGGEWRLLDVAQDEEKEEAAFRIVFNEGH